MSRPILVRWPETHSHPPLFPPKKRPGRRGASCFSLCISNSFECACTFHLLMLRPDGILSSPTSVSHAWPASRPSACLAPFMPCMHACMHLTTPV